MGKVELQGISNEFCLLILREGKADKGIQVAIGLKRPYYVIKNSTELQQESGTEV